MPAKEITFNDVPAILGTIDGRLTRIEGLLQAPADPKPQHQMMTIDELIDYLPNKVKKATIYGVYGNRRVYANLFLFVTAQAPVFDISPR